MAATWPVQLQQKLNETSFSYKLGNTVIKTNMSTGPVKRRRRFTEGIDGLTCTIDLHYSNFTIFKSFYDTTINGGVDSFEFNHPFTGVLTEFKMDTPGITRLGGEWFRVNMTWEVVN